MYVWFEATPDAAPAIEQGFHKLRQMLADQHGGSAAGRLLRRTSQVLREGVPHDTWMEVWPAIPAAQLKTWLDQLEQQSHACGYTACCGMRHTEIFAPYGIERTARTMNEADLNRLDGPLNF